MGTQTVSPAPEESAQVQNQAEEPRQGEEVQQEKERRLDLTELLGHIVDESTKRALVDQEIDRRIFNENWRIAKVFAGAKVFADATDVYKAMAKIEMGRSWGLNQAESMRHVFFVHGKPSCENEPIAAKLKLAGWDWDPQFLGSEHDCKGCRLWISKDGHPLMRQKRGDDGSFVFDKDSKPVMEQVSVAFTEAQAKAIKIHEKGKMISVLEKENWATGWRQNMYYWKAIAQFKRFFAPGIMNGALMAVETGEISGPTPVREHASVSIDQIIASSDANRGHDAANGSQEAQQILSKEQRALIIDAANRAHKDARELEAVIKAHGFASVKDVTPDKLEAIIAELEKGDAEE